MKKRESNPSPPTAAVPPEPPAPVAPPPQTLADIPNLGPIRLRALQKAGYHDLRELKEAPPEDIAAVPGMSEIKAKQLADYLAQFPELPAIPLAPPPPAKKTQAAASAPPVLPLLVLAANILSETNHLLLRLPDTERRPRLSREFERLEETLVPFIGAISSVASEDFLQLESVFNFALKALLETRNAEKFNKKTQGELADALDTFHAALRTVTARQTTSD